MKLSNLTTSGRDLVAVEGDDGKLYDTGTLLGRPGLSMDELISDAADLLPELTEKLADASAEALVDQEGTVWRPPSPQPSKIVGVALNNAMFSQLAYRRPTEPSYFLKPPSALTGHLGPIVVPADYGLTHPEPELAAIIGKRARNLTPENALDAVFGYTITNDITSVGLKDRDSLELEIPIDVGSDFGWRHRQAEDDFSIYLTYHARSKGCDTFAPMGPSLVTADEIDDPDNLEVNCYLDDELVLTDSTANLTFSVQTVLAHLSGYMTLEPGDVVHFGSAFKSALPDRYPTIRSLDMNAIGGTFTVEIPGIGRLSNPVEKG